MWNVKLTLINFLYTITSSVIDLACTLSAFLVDSFVISYMEHLENSRSLTFAHCTIKKSHLLR
jgi:hypothetical protein